jgi:hypothetical protein
VTSVDNIIMIKYVITYAVEMNQIKNIEDVMFVCFSIS